MSYTLLYIQLISNSIICSSDERGLSRKHIIESVKASLSRLQLSYIDVVIVHKADPMCPMEGKTFLFCDTLSTSVFQRLSGQ